MEIKYKRIPLLLISVITCSLAQGLTIIAIPWYFTDELNLSSQFSLLYGLVTLIGLFWGLYAGVIIDTCNRKKILLYINWISMFIFGAIGTSKYFLGTLNPFLIFFGFATCSFYYTIFFPNLYALAQELTQKKEYIKINSLIEVFFQTTSIIAAIMCGLLLSGSETLFEYFNWTFFEFQKWTINEIFILNSILYFITATLLTWIPYDYQNLKNVSNPTVFSTLKEIKKASDFLMKKKAILIYGICSQIIFAFLIVELFALLPLFVKNCLNENIIVFSLADVTYGLGAIIAGIITIKILKHINKVSFTLFLILIAGYAFLIMIKFPNIIIFFLTTLIIGVTNASTRITRMSYFFENIPNYIIGRTTTIFNSINTIIRGVLIFIFSAAWFSEKSNVIIGYKIGVFILIIFALPLIWQMRNEKLN